MFISQIQQLVDTRTVRFLSAVFFLEIHCQMTQITKYSLPSFASQLEWN